MTQSIIRCEVKCRVENYMATRCGSLSSFQIHTKNAKRPNRDNERSPVNLSVGSWVDLYPNVVGKGETNAKKGKMLNGECGCSSCASWMESEFCVGAQYFGLRWYEILIRYPSWFGPFVHVCVARVWRVRKRNRTAPHSRITETIMIARNRWTFRTWKDRLVRYRFGLAWGYTFSYLMFKFEVYPECMAYVARVVNIDNQCEWTNCISCDYTTLIIKLRQAFWKSNQLTSISMEKYNFFVRTFVIEVWQRLCDSIKNAVNRLKMK